MKCCYRYATRTKLKWNRSTRFVCVCARVCCKRHNNVSDALSKILYKTLDRFEYLCSPLHWCRLYRRHNRVGCIFLATIYIHQILRFAAHQLALFSAFTRRLTYNIIECVCILLKFEQNDTFCGWKTGAISMWWLEKAIKQRCSNDEGKPETSISLNCCCLFYVHTFPYKQLGE